MFIVRDTRKIQEILHDDDLRELKLARRPGEFKGGEVSTLCRASNAPQLKSVEYLNLYANKLTSLIGLNHGLAGGRLRELNLGNNKLSDVSVVHCVICVGSISSMLSMELPSELALLAPSLKKLWLDDNQISVLPASVLELHELTMLRLSRNQLVQLPAQIRMLSKLEDLAVDNNKLKELPATVGDLACLQSLNVRQNALKTLPPELMTGLADCLLVLNASSNQLGASDSSSDEDASNGESSGSGANDEGSFLAGIGELRRLEELRLNGNKLKIFPLGVLSLPNLKVLNLSNNALPHPLPAAVTDQWGPLDSKGHGLESKVVEVTVRGNPCSHPLANAPATAVAVE